MISDPIFYLVATPAVILTGLAKGGFAGVGILAMPLIALAISPIQGAAIILPILVVQDAVGLWVYRKDWDKRNLAILLPGAAIGVVLGTILAAYVSDAEIALAVGLISVGFAGRRLVAEWLAIRLPDTRAGVANGLFWGAVAGFTSLIANAGAPPFQVYVMPQRLARDLFIGTSVLFFAVLNWMKLPAFIALGQFTKGTLLTSLALFPLALVSTWAGVILVRRVDAGRFYRVIYLLLFAVGIKLIWDGAKGMLA